MGPGPEIISCHEDLTLKIIISREGGRRPPSNNDSTSTQHTRAAPNGQEWHPIDDTDKNHQVIKKKVAEGHLQKKTRQAPNRLELHPINNTDKHSQVSKKEMAEGHLETMTVQAHITQE